MCYEVNRLNKALADVTTMLAKAKKSQALFEREVMVK
jgi:hypothetical protein